MPGCSTSFADENIKNQIYMGLLGMSMILQSDTREGLEITAVRNSHELESIMREWEMLQKVESNPVADVDPYPIIFFSKMCIAFGFSDR